MSANDLWEGGEDLSPRKHWGSWGRDNKSSGTAFPPSTQDPGWEHPLRVTFLLEPGPCRARDRAPLGPAVSLQGTPAPRWLGEVG